MYRARTLFVLRRFSFIRLVYYREARRGIFIRALLRQEEEEEEDKIALAREKRVPRFCETLIKRNRHGTITIEVPVKSVIITERVLRRREKEGLWRIVTQRR